MAYESALRKQRRVTVTGQVTGCTSPYTNIAVGMVGVVEDRVVKSKGSGYNGPGSGNRVVFYNVSYNGAYHTITIPMTNGRSEVLACAGVKLTVTKDVDQSV